MVLYTAFFNRLTAIYAPPPVTKSFINTNTVINLKFKKTTRNFESKIHSSQQQIKSSDSIQYSSLKLLEWDKLCDLVSSFAATSLARRAIQVQLWSLNRNYEESLLLMKETNAAIEMHKHGSCRLDFTGIDLVMVESGIDNARRGFPISANEAIAVVSLLEYADVLQLNLKAAIKEGADWYNRFMPLSEMITELVTNRPLVRMIQQVIDGDGSVKDSASSALKQSRDQVRRLEKKLYQLMDSLIKKDMEEASLMEVSNVNGRWCLKSGTNQLLSYKGLLLSSDSGTGSILEPLSAVPLNDELQRARASVAKAESDVLLMLTEMMKEDLDGIEKLLNNAIQLDMINARASYSLSFGGSCPDLYFPEDMDGLFTAEASEMQDSKASHPTKREWILYMAKAYHPLLLQQHRLKLQKAKKDLKNSKFQKLQGDNGMLNAAHPVPVDFFISQNTRVLVITGPNTGGKTICLKTVGLAAMMAKSGLYVLSSESVQLPWFDYIFADIGDEQSLSQSLSTFSGHLKQISDIRSQSTRRSLVLLDEVGAGTNPLEGAALGMSLLESFADSGALLTIATTHHGELKSLKYSNGSFENACMEFDEVNLKPTYKILWGIPGRSNAISISEKLGLPETVIDSARELYGAASAEINEVIIDMERFKQDFQELLHEAQHHIRLSRDLHKKLLLARRKIMDHGSGQRYRMLQEISEVAATSRSALHKKVRQRRAYLTTKSSHLPSTNTHLRSDQHITEEISGSTVVGETSSSIGIKTQPSSAKVECPQVGETVQVSSLGTKGTVLRVDQSKGEIMVQAGKMKLKLKLTDVRT
ncbi:uncharacterized protein LOC126687114 [Mercurialis annua]|uniref:uncharacterized protein LOC126687114 n=1 Tax=Mercurialis annua TaxID=3986 RepID=UPI00215E6315|nr:uncharacterized protein LOC126687114 [Mercurialis annua]XP_050237451.1 uncharacterized protein LOC126687114 [Mercurialis annua]